MNLTDALFALIAPTTIGDVFEGFRLVDVSSELGLRLVFERDGREIVVEVDPVTEGRKFAARSSSFTFAYRVGDRVAPIDAGVGRALCELVAARAEVNEREVLAKLGEIAPAATEGGVRVREVRGPRILERAGTPDERYWTLSPYIGCLIGCRFCYAPSRLDVVRRLTGAPAAPWGSWVDVRVDAAEALRRDLATMPVLPIKMCPIVSDPYHAIEKRYRMTRACLEVLRDAEPRDVLVLTRSTMIVDDAALLASLPRAWAGVSLPTVDDEVRKHFEPRGASVQDRLAALSTLRAAGVRTFAIVQPLFPGPIDELADALSAHVSSVRVDVLYGTFAADGDFARYPNAADPEWQRARGDELVRALAVRGVKVWRGELPE